MVPLRYLLKNGDIIEIITSNRQHPRKDWLDFVKTTKAKSRIRQWIKKEERDESVIIGKNILEKSLEQSQLNITNITKNQQLTAVAKDLSFQTLDDLLANVGYGKISANQVLGRLRPKLGIEKEERDNIVRKVVSKITRKKSSKGISVKGIDDMLVRFANCCHPLPGEHVLGFITRGRGVTIHKYNCSHILDSDPERLVEVQWDPADNDVYLARIKVTSVDRKGILADVSAIMAKKEANIINAEIKTTMDKKGVSFFAIEVESYKQLEEILGAIKKVENVLIVERV
jgi:GTP pyrophosphokinase